ncbi:hypothetical protein NVV31_22850 [Cytobacillus firmus]|uniref:hypothetical protein n=2 Tax=Cytobacillus TaxID=2675230 RepID=UPI0021C8EBC1|nr:hypothetical protein [Cytobacillus firmus]MCU1808214.1 hypothetical protein [Cytobacillus firmus]
MEKPGISLPRKVRMSSGQIFVKVRNAAREMDGVSSSLIVDLSGPISVDIRLRKKLACTFSLVAETIEEFNLSFKSRKFIKNTMLKMNKKRAR